jgi:hypothetical protein
MTTPTRNQQLEDRTRIRHTAIEISALTRGDLLYFLDVMLSEFPPERRQEFIDAVINRQFEDQGRWLKIDRWMNSCFEKHYHYKPKQVAHMCCVYWKMNWGMERKLILRAQEIKRKVAKRQKYALLSQL